MALSGQFFNATYYLSQYADVAANWSGSALAHYEGYGASEGRVPNSWFDAQYYRANSEAAVQSMTALEAFAHYEVFGYAEGRAVASAYASFDAAQYLADYSDLGTGGITEGMALNHFLVYGSDENRIAKDTNGNVISGPSSTPGQSYSLTTAVDLVTGTAGDDTIVGIDTTFTTGDQIDGGAGTDTVSVTLGAANTAVATLTNIETVKLQAAAAATGIVASSWSGVSNINFVNTTANIGVTGLTSIPTLNITNSSGGTAALTLADAIVAGTSDAISVNLYGFNPATAKALTIKGATAGGIETWNITTGEAASKADVSGSTGMKTLNVSGDKALDLSSAATPTSVTSVNASGMTAGGLKIDLTGSTLTSVTGSAANDTILLSTTAVGTTVIDGGEGTDILGLNIANVPGALATTSKITNVETLQIQDAVTLAAAATRALGTVTGLTNLTYGALLTTDNGTTNAFVETVTGLADGSTVRFNAGTANTGSGGETAAQRAGGIVFTLTGAAAASNDTLNIVTAKGAAAAAAEAIEGFTAANVENLVFDIKSLTGNTTTIDAVYGSQLKTVTIKSSAVTALGAATDAANLTVGGTDAFNSTIIDTVDVSGYQAATTGVVNIAALSSSMIASGATITGPSKGILIATGGAGADKITTGAGGSNSGSGITGGAGADTIDLSASAAKVDLLTVGATDSTEAIMDSITGFTSVATLGDHLELNGAQGVLANVGAGTATGVTNLTASTTNGIMTFAGTAADAATLAQKIDGATHANFANSAANKVVAFVHDGATYIVGSGATTATTDDTVIKLAGVTDLTALSATASAANTAYVS